MADGSPLGPRSSPSWASIWVKKSGVARTTRRVTTRSCGPRLALQDALPLRLDHIASVLWHLVQVPQDAVVGRLPLSGSHLLQVRRGDHSHP
jgi:hypothetical protein